MEILDLDEPGPEPEPPARQPVRRFTRTHRRWWWGAGVVLVVVLTLLFVDQRARYRETDDLLDQVVRTESALRYADGRIGSAVQYTRPNLTSVRVPERVRAGLRVIVQKEAAARVPPLAERRRAMAAVPVRSWHGGQARARDAYLAYLDERIAGYRAMSSDLRILFRPQPAIARRREAARQDLLALNLSPREAARVESLLPEAP